MLQTLSRNMQIASTSVGLTTGSRMVKTRSCLIVVVLKAIPTSEGRPVLST